MRRARWYDSHHCAACGDDLPCGNSWTDVIVCPDCAGRGCKSCNNVGEWRAGK